MDLTSFIARRIKELPSTLTLSPVGMLTASVIIWLFGLITSACGMLAARQIGHGRSPEIWARSNQLKSPGRRPRRSSSGIFHGMLATSMMPPAHGTMTKDDRCSLRSSEMLTFPISFSRRLRQPLPTQRMLTGDASWVTCYISITLLLRHFINRLSCLRLAFNCIMLASVNRAWAMLPPVQVGGVLRMTNANVRLDYDLGTGRANFYWQNKLKITGFYAGVGLDEYITDTVYTNRTWSFTSNQVEVISRRGDLPTLKQIF